MLVLLSHLRMLSRSKSKIWQALPACVLLESLLLVCWSLQAPLSRLIPFHHCLFIIMQYCYWKASTEFQTLNPELSAVWFQKTAVSWGEESMKDCMTKWSFVTARSDNWRNRQGSAPNNYWCWSISITSWLWQLSQKCGHFCEWVHLPWHSWLSSPSGTLFFMQCALCSSQLPNYT